MAGFVPAHKAAALGRHAIAFELTPETHSISLKPSLNTLSRMPSLKERTLL
jgi:hypothetical protein